MTEKKIAKILVKKLVSLGFVVHRYDAITTSSIYLKLDFGLSCGIRISNHKGKAKYHYRFNVIKDYEGDKITFYKNLISYLMNYHNYCKKFRKKNKIKFKNMVLIITNFIWNLKKIQIHFLIDLKKCLKLERRKPYGRYRKVRNTSIRNE